MRHALLLTALLLAACSARDPVADQANNTANLTAVVNAATERAEAAQENAASPPADVAAPTPTGAAAPGGPIPAALQGRWGLTPRDCTSALGDAKGLLVVSGDALRFYESRAVPSARATVAANAIAADFAFTGEGQKWTKFETLQLKGDKLVRTESTPMASFTYARCT